MAFIAWAASNMALAVALWPLVPPWVAVLLILVSIGPLGATFFVADPITTSREQGSTTGRWHAVFGVLFVLGFPVVAALLAVYTIATGSPLHIAGPFSATCRPMADACLRTGTHYLDITSEIDVFDALAARDAEAKRAGIMLMPGCGFDVVPSDCLAAHLKGRLPDATDLKIEIGGLNAVSHGTMESMVESVPKGARVRRDGRIVSVPHPKETSCDFGEGPIPTLVLPWGDVSTAYYSTGIRNIEVRMAVTPPLRIAMTLPGFARSLALPWPC